MSSKRGRRQCLSCDGHGRVADPDHGQGQTCGGCGGSGFQQVVVDEDTGKYHLEPAKTAFSRMCGVAGCSRDALPDRNICENHAFPAARPPGTTGRRAAVFATRKKLAEEAKVSEDLTDEVDEEPQT